MRSSMAGDIASARGNPSSGNDAARKRDDPQTLCSPPGESPDVDPWGLEPEFTDTRPILPQSPDDDDRLPTDLEWDISPELNCR